MINETKTNLRMTKEIFHEMRKWNPDQRSYHRLAKLAKADKYRGMCDAAQSDLVREIEQFEHNQQTANKWISCRRIAAWRVGKGDPVADVDLAPAYRELKDILCHAKAHQIPERVMIMSYQIGGPTEIEFARQAGEPWAGGPWYPSHKDCAKYIAGTDHTAGNDLARITEKDGFLIGGVWVRRDLVREICDGQGWQAPPWLPSGDAGIAAAVVGKEGGQPSSMDAIEAELDRWIAGRREVIMAALQRWTPAETGKSKARISRALSGWCKQSGGDTKANTIEKVLRDRIGAALDLI